MSDPGKPLADFVYRSHDDLRALGEQVRDTAIRVTMTHDSQYGYAQQRINSHNADPAGYTPAPGTASDDAENVRRFATAEFANIPDMFTSFALPDPNDCQPTVDALFRVAATLRLDLALPGADKKFYLPYTMQDDPLRVPLRDTVRATKLRMQHWTGTGADRFKVYLEEFEGSIDFQRGLAVSLALTLQSQMEIRKRILTDVWETGNTTIKVLDALDAWHCPTRGGAALSLTVVGAVAAVLAAATAQEGIAVGITAAISGSAGSILSTSGPYTVSQPMSGATVPGVIISMQNALAKVRTNADRQSQDLVTGLAALDQEIHAVAAVIQLRDPTGDVDLSTMTAAQLDITGGRYFYDR
jgi:hypothetical protein